MKHILFFGILFIGVISCTNAQDEINWMSMDEALEAQKETPKKIMMDAYTVWCGPCKMMDKNTFGNKDVIAYVNENYYPVKFNAEGNDTITYRGKDYTNPKYDPNRKSGRNYQHELAQFIGVRGYPSIVFFDEAAEVITSVMGYRKPRQIELFLKMFATDDYKELNSNEAVEAYQKNFEPSFTD